MAKDDIEFPNGLIVKPPHERAPSYVKAAISIKVEDLGKWLREKYKAGEEWVNLDIRESNNGRWYAAVNSFKKTKTAEQPAAKPTPKKASQKDDDGDIPF